MILVNVQAVWIARIILVSGNQVAIPDTIDEFLAARGLRVAQASRSS